MVQVRGVRKPSLVLVKGGRGKVATPPLTDDERYPRFPPAWVDWLVLGLLLAMLNLPSPVPLLSGILIVAIAVFVARLIAKDGGDDPNCQNGATVVIAEFFMGLMNVGMKRPLERTMSVEPFTKQIVIFIVCEATLYCVPRVFASYYPIGTFSFLSLLLFLVVTFLGWWALMWWDTSSSSPPPRVNHHRQPHTPLLR